MCLGGVKNACRRVAVRAGAPARRSRYIAVPPAWSCACAHRAADRLMAVEGLCNRLRRRLPSSTPSATSSLAIARCMKRRRSSPTMVFMVWNSRRSRCSATSPPARSGRVSSRSRRAFAETGLAVCRHALAARQARRSSHHDAGCRAQAKVLGPSASPRRRGCRTRWWEPDPRLAQATPDRRRAKRASRRAHPDRRTRVHRALCRRAPVGHPARSAFIGTDRCRQPAGGGRDHRQSRRTAPASAACSIFTIAPTRAIPTRHWSRKYFHLIRHVHLNDPDGSHPKPGEQHISRRSPRFPS